MSCSNKHCSVLKQVSESHDKTPTVEITQHAAK